MTQLTTEQKEWKMIIREDFENPPVFKYLTNDEYRMVEKSRTGTGFDAKIMLYGDDYFVRNVNLRKITAADREALSKPTGAVTVWTDRVVGFDQENEAIWIEEENNLLNGILTKTGKTRLVSYKTGVRQLIKEN